MHAAVREERSPVVVMAQSPKVVEYGNLGNGRVDHFSFKILDHFGCEC